jgi:hypothetical protein
MDVGSFYMWAEHPIASCHPHASKDEGLTRPAEPQECEQTRCSRSQLVTLPATVVVGCGGLATTANHHRKHRKQPTRGG